MSLCKICAGLGYYADSAGRHPCTCVAHTLKERTPEAKAAYLQGYTAGQRDERAACARVADEYAATLKGGRSVFDRIQTAESLAAMIRSRHFG
jgi:hypothetical protein